ncbi:MAG: glycosyltransferase family 2 protein [Anaerolineales bacterium]|nr:glycosyltransferase family 2 protein [Anaerolineales bacterium]
MPPLLSIIIPAYNEELRLPGSLENIISFLGSQPYEYEVLIVENGSQDRTYEIAQDFERRYPFVRALSEPKAGKGLAVRRGMLAAEGEYRFIADADLSMPIEEVALFLPPNAPEFDIAIASREAPGAVRIGEPIHRHWIGRMFNLLVRLLVLPGIQDTQCGFKCFRSGAAGELFKEQTLDGWTFDVEILYIARKRGYRIIEIPIHWHFNPGSRVHILRDSISMFLDLIRIRLNDLRGLYKSSNGNG